MCEIAGFNYDDKSISHEAIVNHVKSLRDTCDEYHEEIVNMKKKMEDLEKEKYEIIDTLNERYHGYSFKLFDFKQFSFLVGVEAERKSS